MSREEIRQTRITQLTIQPAPVDADVQYDTMMTCVGESQCIGEDIE